MKTAADWEIPVGSRNTGICVNGDGELAIGTGIDGTIEITDIYGQSISSIALTSVPVGFSVQGVSWDPGRSAYWVCLHDVSAGLIRRYSTAGAVESTITPGLGIAGPNGCVYDATNDRLLTLWSDNIIRGYNCVTGAVDETITVDAAWVSTGATDHLAFNDGDETRLWLALDGRQTCGRILRSTGAFDSAEFSIPHSPEGLTFLGGYLYLCCDRELHEAIPAGNRVYRYDVSSGRLVGLPQHSAGFGLAGWGDTAWGASPAQAGGASLAASGGAVPGGTATPSATVALAGVTIAQPGGSALPAAAVALSETAITLTGGSANPSATVSVSASGIANVAASLNLSAAVLLAAADGAQAGGNPTLAALLSAMVSGGAQPGGSATPTGNTGGHLSASGGAEPGGNAGPSADAALGVLGGAQPGGAPVMSVTVALVASDGAQPGGAPALTATVHLTAAGFVNVMTTGVLAIEVALSALDGAAPGGLANPQAAGTLLLASALWTLPDLARGWTVADPARRWELPQ